MDCCAQSKGRGAGRERNLLTSRVPFALALAPSTSAVMRSTCLEPAQATYTVASRCCPAARVSLASASPLAGPLHTRPIRVVDAGRPVVGRMSHQLAPPSVELMSTPDKSLAKKTFAWCGASPGAPGRGHAATMWV